MNERDFQRQVIFLAKLYHWKFAHFGNTVKFRREKNGGYSTVPDPQGAGFPDLVMVRDGVLVFAELKSETGRLRPAQREWLDRLKLVPSISVYVWRPSDLDEIAVILR